MIPIFDALTHPTLDETWLDQNKTASLAELLAWNEQYQIEGFCAVGLPGVGSYDHQLYIESLAQTATAFPVAAIHPTQHQDFAYIASLGYRAIKLHPRLSQFALDADNVDLCQCFAKAAEFNLIIFLCTYISSEINLFPPKDPFWELVKLLQQTPDVRCVLLHGGGARLLQYADLVRFNPNLLLDLSYTLIKSKGSSLDLDLQYLFTNLDQKLCIGTDYPDYNARDLRQRLLDFEPFTSHEKLCNIYHKNLRRFLGCE